MIQPLNIVFLSFLALTPTLLVMVYIYIKDTHEREPFHLLLKTFLWGCVSVVPALLMQTAANYFNLDAYTVPLGAFGFTLFIVAFSEELSKFLFVRFYAFRKRDFNEPFDGIVYSIMVGMGFATVENVLYVLRQDSFSDSLIAGVARIFTAVPAHAAFAIVMGYYVGMAKFRPSHKAVLLFCGLFGATVLHAFYDYFLIQQNSIVLSVGAFVSLTLAISLSLRAIKLHSHNSPFRLKPPLSANEPS